MKYCPGIFEQPTRELAEKIILTVEGNQSSEQRWETETPYLIELINDKFSITSETKIIDYGCGIGRLAKPLIEKFNCIVVGVDISRNMRDLAVQYVNSKRFHVVHPIELLKYTFPFDLIVSVWTLQHVLVIEDDIRAIKSRMNDNTKLFIVNNNQRAIPYLDDEGEFCWANDMVNVQKELQENFNQIEIGKLDETRTSKEIHDRTFYGIYTRLA